MAIKTINSDSIIIPVLSIGMAYHIGDTAIVFNILVLRWHGIIVKQGHSLYDSKMQKRSKILQEHY